MSKQVFDNVHVLRLYQQKPALRRLYVSLVGVYDGVQVYEAFETSRARKNSGFVTVLNGVRVWARTYHTDKEAFLQDLPSKEALLEMYQEHNLL